MCGIDWNHEPLLYAAARQRHHPHMKIDSASRGAMSTRHLCALLSLVGFAVAFATSARATPIDSARLLPRISPWHAIGGIGIGMIRSAVEYRYGTAPSEGTVLVYKVPKGVLYVQYHHSRVTDLETNSPYFRTSDGLGVGSTIPLGPCHRVGNGCRYLWSGFELWSNPYVKNASEWYRMIEWDGHRLRAAFRVSSGGVVNDVQITVWPVVSCNPPPAAPPGECG